MNRIQFHVLAIAFAILGSSAAAENLIPNPSFENATAEATPAAWKLDRGKMLYRADGGRTGERYVRLVDRGRKEAHMVISQPVSVRPGGTYTASAWIRSRDKGAPGIYLAFYGVSGARISAEYQKIKMPAESWARVSITRPAPDGAARVAVFLYSFMADVGSFDFDDVALTVEGGAEPHDAPKVKPSHAEAVTVASRRELFVDRHLIDGMHRVQFQLHRPHDEGIVLRFDQPWEGPFCGYATILTVDGGYRAYYRGRPGVGKDGDITESTCVAESKDGITWTRPQLGIHEIDGSAANNVVLHRQAPYSHNFSPFVDANPAVKPDEKFKGIGGIHPEGPALFVSADGYRWKLKQKSILTSKAFAFDSQACAFWSVAEKRYVCYFRTWKNGVRWVSRVTSEDCLSWSPPVEMISDRPAEHFYTSQTHPYFRAPHLYVSLPARFVPKRQVISAEEAEAIGVNPKYFKDTSDAILVTSRPERPHEFVRTFMSSFIRPGIGPENWVSRANYPALNVVQTGPHEMSIFMNQNYAQPTAHLRRYSMRLDGFSSLRADYDGGEILTKPLRFTGDRLLLNFATSAAGEIRIELQEADGTVFPGFSLDECREVIGNEIEREVKWAGAGNLQDLAGRPVRLRIVMKDADLFALRFVGSGKTSAAVPKKASHPSYAPVEDVAGLPRVLLIGDSISMGYTLPVRRLLQGKANVHRPMANCGPTASGLKYLDQWLGEKKWDVIHFNWGLHDVMHYKGSTAKSDRVSHTTDGATRRSSEAVYEQNLRKLVERLKATGAKLIWASTTPIPGDSVGIWKPGDAERYNRIAAKVMKENNIAVNDLWTTAQPHLNAIQNPRDVHFNSRGSEQLAKAVVRAVSSRLNPLP